VAGIVWRPPGQTPEEAVTDLREAFDGWFAEFGVPDELTITVRASPSMTSGGCSSAADVADAARQVLPGK
jgi:hypothetical protein